MTCPKCQSQNVNVQVTNQVTLKNKHHSIIWWICIGWWWEMILWLFLTLPKLLVTIFGHKKQKTVNKTVSNAVCQNCGYTWKI